MAIEVKLPHLGEGIEAGDVLDLMVKEGDRVERDQGILEIETDKATVEVPSPEAGFVKQIHVAAGQTIKVGAVLVTLEAEAGAAASAPPAEPAPQESAPPPSDTPAKCSCRYPAVLAGSITSNCKRANRVRSR